MSSAERALKRRGLKEQRKAEQKTNKLEAQLRRLYEQGYKDGMDEAIEITLYMMAYTINYKLGFGRKRLQQIIHDVYNNIDAFRTEHLDKKDYEEIKKQMNDLGIYYK